MTFAEFNVETPEEYVKEIMRKADVHTTERRKNNVRTKNIN